MTRVATISEGGIFGEGALLTHAVRSAMVKCIAEKGCVCSEIGGSELRKVPTQQHSPKNKLSCICARYNKP